MENLTDVINATADFMNGTGIDPIEAKNSLENSAWSIASEWLAAGLNVASEKVLGRAGDVTPQMASWLLVGISALFILKNAGRIWNILVRFGYVAAGAVILVLALILFGVKF